MKEKRTVPQLTMKEKKFLTVRLSFSPLPPNNNTSKNEKRLLQPFGYLMLNTK